MAEEREGKRSWGFERFLRFLGAIWEVLKAVMEDRRRYKMAVGASCSLGLIFGAVLSGEISRKE